ncbi:MAG: glycoside hydrolase family 9 protein [Promethearchaeota archaeon]
MSSSKVEKRPWYLQLPLDLKIGVVYIVVGAVILALLILFGFYSNYETVHGRYEYSGNDVMSPFGLLDAAHYRTTALEETLCWQFFFGNMQVFIIFSLALAGFFHLFRIKLFSASLDGIKNKNRFDIEIVNGKRFKILGISSIIIIIVIIVLEIGFSSFGTTEAGLGNHIFIDSYYRDIPTLVGSGFYVVNNKPYFPQVFASFLPLFCGFGGFFFFHGLKMFRRKSYISVDLGKKNLLGIGLLVVALLYYVILLSTTRIRIQELFTGYTLFLTVFWTLNALWISGEMIIFLRLFFMPIGFSARGGYKFKIKPILRTFAVLILAILSVIGFLLPHLGKLGIGEDVEFTGVEVVPFIFIGIATLLVFMFLRKRDIEPLARARMICFIGGFGALMFVLILYALVSINNNGSLELGWAYNGIIPSIFILFLTISFYFGAVKIKALLMKVNMKIREISATRGKKTSSIIKKHAILRKIKTHAILHATLILLASSIPTLLTFKIYREKPQIIINNLGLFPDQEKTFLFATNYDHPEDTGSFKVIDVASGRVVYTGEMFKVGYIWGRYHWLGNFTPLVTEGKYYIEGKLGIYSAKSFEFQINQSYLDIAYQTGLYWYYYQRCGTVVHEIIPGYPGHGLCHEHDAWFLYKHNNGTYEFIRAGDVGLNLTGGWHDSGDYNVYGYRMIVASHALPFSFGLEPRFFKEPARMQIYPQNDSIPDIIEEAWFGLQFWARRWYEPEQKYFDSNCLGKYGHLRWTVFGPPEYEEDFGNGRWITDDLEGFNPDNPDHLRDENFYKFQFITTSRALMIAATFAQMARICKENGYYAENVTFMELMANKTRAAYGHLLDNSQFSLACESEMYKLTGNLTYFNNAVNIVNSFISNTADISEFPAIDNEMLGYVLNFIKDFNGTNGWDGFGYLKGNNTLENLGEIILSRTYDQNNIFHFLRTEPNGTSIYNNARFLRAMFAAAFAWNMTENATLKRIFYNFITNHYDWLFGRNMENICLMEGLREGENNVYEYHGRYPYIPGNIRGGCPGFIADGFEKFPDEENYENKGVFSPYTNVYNEVWSDIAYSFQLATAAFYSQVLGR